MKSRTCPDCGYKYSFKEYYQKIIFKSIDSKWNCTKCGVQLTFRVGRRTIVAIIAMLPLLFNHLIISFLNFNLGITKWISWLIFAILFILWLSIIYSFDSFETIKKKD